MRRHSLQFAILALILWLAAAGLTACSTVRPYAHGGTDHPTQAGASVSVPFGR